MCVSVGVWICSRERCRPCLTPPQSYLCTPGTQSQSAFSSALRIYTPRHTSLPPKHPAGLFNFHESFIYICTWERELGLSDGAVGCVIWTYRFRSVSCGHNGYYLTPLYKYKWFTPKIKEHLHNCGMTILSYYCFLMLGPENITMYKLLQIKNVINSRTYTYP